MEKTISICEICGKRAEDEKQKRKENWIQTSGGTNQCIYVWLEKPREAGKGTSGNYMHSVGWQSRTYHFCCVKCLVKALEQASSI